MRKTKNAKVALLGLLALTGFMLVGVPGQAIGQDTDKDGIPDSVEKSGGITLRDGKVIPPCQLGMDRHRCLDWQTPDLFVILARATGCPNPAPICAAPNVQGVCSPLYGGRGNIPSPSTSSSGPPYVNSAYDPWELVEAHPLSGGLGITIHEITSTQVPSTRVVYSGTGQKALKITESLDTCGTDLLGYSNWGTPNTTGIAVLYTQRIINKVNQECGTLNNTCSDAVTGEAGRNNLYVNYIQSLLAHELGHVIALTKLWTPSYGGPHEASGSGFVMEQKPIVKVITGTSPTVKWYISNDWSNQSRSDFNLLK
jgi:hypothetical protein